MARKQRSDTTIGSLEKILGLGPGAFRREDGRDIRSDMKLGNLRKEYDKKKKK